MTAAAGDVRFLELLAHDLRWQILAALARSDYRVQDLVGLLGRPMNVISYHLGLLRRSMLVRGRRSDADSRDAYYSLQLERLRELYSRTGESIHPALASCAAPRREVGAESRGCPARVLFLCTENSARSQMAEGILRHFSRGEVDVMSAGSRPTRLNPLAVRVLAEHGIDISHHRAKSLDEFRGQGFDYVITVCDRIKETCPSFPGDPERIHWSLADPAAVEGSEEQRYLASKETARELMTMVRYLLIMFEQRWSGPRGAATGGKQ